MPVYSSLQDLFACGPAKYGFDAPGGGQVFYWSAVNDVVAKVYRSGDLDAAAHFFFRVLDKRRMPPNATTIEDGPWEWRDETGSLCKEPTGVVAPLLATESDYHDRIVPALKRIEQSFFDSFSLELSGDTSQSAHFNVQNNRWVNGLPPSQSTK